MPNARAERCPTSSGDEPGAGVERANLAEIEIRNAKSAVGPRVALEPRGDVGRSNQRVIVEDDRDTIAGQLNVELPGVGTGLPGEASGFECVLGSVKRIAPMRDDHRIRSACLQKREKTVRRIVHEVFSRIDCRG